MQLKNVCVYALGLGLIFGGAASAQTGQRGSISGTVKDGTGGSIAAVQVSAQNAETSVITTAVTNEAGVYLISSLVTGKYKLLFTKTGFNVQGREVEVRTGDQIRLDISLAIGDITQEVSVTAATPLLTTSTATRGTTFSGDLVQNLPINGRNPFMLVLSTPGVVGEPDRASISFRPFDNGGMDRFSANGGVNSSNQFLLNGAPNTNGGDSNGNNLSFVPPPEAIQEVRVETNVYDAQFGRSGSAVVNVTVRSGTNTYHGSVAYLGRNKALNQNLYQARLAGIPKTDLYHYNPVASFGGPVKVPGYDGSGKTFFFASYEFLRSGVPNSVTQRAPTELEKKGDFSQSGLTGPLRDPVTGAIFPGNVIPAGRMDPVALAMLPYMPSPNIAPDASGNNYIPTPNSRFDIYQSFLTRIDQNMGNHRLSATFGTNGRHEDRANNGRQEVAIAGQDGHHRRWNDNFGLDLTSTFGPSMVNSLKFGWVHHTRKDNNLDDPFDPASLALGPRYLGLTPRTNYFQPVTIDTYSGANVGTGGNGFYTKDHVFSVGETLTKIWGTHQLKAGGEFGVNLDQQQLIADGANIGTFNFSRHYTSTNPTSNNPNAAAGGNPFASFLLGYPRSASLTLAEEPYLYWSGNYLGVYVQDDWRVSGNLTVNLGLRYDLERPPSERNNLVVAGFDAASRNPLSAAYTGALPPGITGRCVTCPTLALDPNIANNRPDGGAALADLVGGPVFADATGGRVYERDGNNLGPRFGATYKLTEKILLRGGWGRTFLNALTDRPPQAQNTRQTPYVPSSDNNLTPLSRMSETDLLNANLVGPALYPNGLLQPYGTAQGLATSVGANVTFHNPDKQNPQFDQYSVGVQYELPWRSVVEVSYVGSQTNKLAINQPLNDLTPEQLALGDAFLDATLPNPFLGLGTGFTGATITRRQLLRPYPEFNNITMALIPEGRQWYNAMQITWEKRYSHGVAMTANYTYSQAWEEVDPLNQGEPRHKQHTGSHRPHVVRLTGTWDMPKLLDQNAWVRGFAGGWSLGTVATFRRGTLVAMPGNVDVIGDYTLTDGNRGRWFNTCTLGVDGVTRNACADPGVDERAADPGRAPLQPAFQLRPNNARDTTGARLEGVYRSSPPNVDINFIKTIKLSGRVNAQIRVELYNMMGAVLFPNPDTGTANFATFGTVATNQSNDPRFVMLNFRVSY